MRKTITGGPEQQEPTRVAGSWLNLAELSHVEVFSEAAGFPIEDALLEPETPEQAASVGWKAGATGPQRIRFLFDTPQPLRHLLVRFRDTENERMQEFAIVLITMSGGRKEIVRQQWTFSPGGSTEETENYEIAADTGNVKGLEITIDPDRGRDRYPATLAALRVGL